MKNLMPDTMPLALTTTDSSLFQLQVDFEVVGLRSTYFYCKVDRV
jgi:hypothetical protein